VVEAVEKAGKAPKTAEAIANCIQQILHNAGIATVGEADAVKRHPTGNKQVANGALQCLVSAAP
jgi:non-canonical (house-cleaning) NTP pyrophosphatase